MTRCYRVTLESEANTRREIYVIAGDMDPGSTTLPPSAAMNCLNAVETEDWKLDAERVVEMVEIGQGFFSPAGL